MSAYEILKHYIEKKKKLGYGTCSYPDYKRKVPDFLMEKWYKDVREYDKLAAHYDVFANCIENEIYYDSAAAERRRYKNRRRWSTRDGYREEQTKWQKKPEYVKKKKLSEEVIRKREWRKKVKDPRNQGSRFYSGSHKKRALRIGNKAERRYVKAGLQCGDWKYYPKSSTYWESYRVCNGECCEHRPTTWHYNYPDNEWDSYINIGKRQWANPWDWT